MEIQDLDILRPLPRFIRLGGKDIDVSFIPCGITFDIDVIMEELNGMDADELTKNGPETKRAFDLSVKLAATFCSHKYPELDEEWFNENTSAVQLKVFVDAVKEALYKAYETIDGGSKNGVATKKKGRNK